MGTDRAFGDGPIASDQMTSSSQPPVVHLSSPDAASALPQPSTLDAAGGSPLASAQQLTAAFNPLLPSGLAPQLAGAWSSLLNSAEQTLMGRLFTGT
jgi:hypothetical protein